MHQDFFIVARELRAMLGSVRITLVHVTVDEVVDHLNVVLNVEFPHGALAKILRDGRNTVALLD